MTEHISSPLLNTDDIKLSAEDAISMLPNSMIETVSGRYEQESEFASQVNACIADLAVRMAAVQMVDKSSWDAFFIKITSMDSQPAFYENNDILAISKQVMIAELMEASESSDSVRIARIIQLADVVGIEDLVV